MTLKEVKTMLEKLDLPVAFNHWKKGQVPELPYILYRKGYSNDFIADDINYVKIFAVEIELYQDDEFYNFDLEERLEELLNEHGFVFDLDSPIHIDTEGMFQTFCTISVLGGRKDGKK